MSETLREILIAVVSFVAGIICDRFFRPPSVSP